MIRVTLTPPASFTAGRGRCVTLLLQQKFWFSKKLKSRRIIVKATLVLRMNQAAETTATSA
jgi:hypothetical protein